MGRSNEQRRACSSWNGAKCPSNRKRCGFEGTTSDVGGSSGPWEHGHEREGDRRRPALVIHRLLPAFTLLIRGGLLRVRCISFSIRTFELFLESARSGTDPAVNQNDSNFLGDWNEIMQTGHLHRAPLFGFDAFVGFLFERLAP
jgi:hypothetical protein